MDNEFTIPFKLFPEIRAGTQKGNAGLHIIHTTARTEMREARPGTARTAPAVAAIAAAAIAVAAVVVAVTVAAVAVAAVAVAAARVSGLHIIHTTARPK